MKNLFIFFVLLYSVTAVAQMNIPPTDTLYISGKITRDLYFTITDLEKHASQPIGDVAISNHLGEFKRNAKNLQGFLVKDILSGLTLTDDKPKTLSEYYFIFIASDNYKVVFSWNEIFNTTTGDNLYIVTNEDGKKMTAMNDRILTVSTKDFKTGRRFIKGLKKIIVERVN